MGPLVGHVRQHTSTQPTVHPVPPPTLIPANGPQFCPIRRVTARYSLPSHALPPKLRQQPGKRFGQCNGCRRLASFCSPHKGCTLLTLPFPPPPFCCETQARWPNPSGHGEERQPHPHCLRSKFSILQPSALPAGSRLMEQASHRHPMSCTSPGVSPAQVSAQAYKQSGSRFQDVPGGRTQNT